MPITLRRPDLDQALERAYVLAISDEPLPEAWLERAGQLSESPSVGFIAAVGAVLLAKATDDRIDAFVIQVQEGSAGAFNLRAAATALAAHRRALGYDIGSSSDRDPINHGTLVSSPRWDEALRRIREDHQPFFQLILRWLHDVNRMDSEAATAALAAYIRVRRTIVSGSAIMQIPDALSESPALSDLVNTIDAFVSADPEGGARGMALTAAAFRTAGFEAVLPSRNDPRRIDIAIRRDDRTVIGSEVKQVATTEATADTLVLDSADIDVHRALLAVLPPGMLVDFDRKAVIRRAERDYGIVLRVAVGAREVIHEALSGSHGSVDEFAAGLPRQFAEALRDIRVTDETLETWAAIASRWE